MKSLSIWCVAAVSWLTWGATAWAQQAPPQPGPEHAVLKHMEGTWDAKIKMGDQESKGTSTSKMGLGGLWLLTDFKGEFEGASFEGRGMDGYDVHKKKYVGVWADSMTSSPMMMEGDYDKESKTLTMVGEGKGPDGKPMKFKGVSTFPDADHYVFKMYMIGPDGNDHLMMTINYAKKK